MRLVKWEKTHDQKLGGWREEMGKGWGRAVVYVIYENGKKNFELQIKLNALE